MAARASNDSLASRSKRATRATAAIQPVYSLRHAKPLVAKVSICSASTIHVSARRENGVASRRATPRSCTRSEKTGSTTAWLIWLAAPWW
jgi:hypothetical protein